MNNLADFLFVKHWQPSMDKVQTTRLALECSEASEIYYKAVKNEKDHTEKPGE